MHPALAAQVVERNGAQVDRASMADFDCPSYDQDVESESIPAPAHDFCRRLKAADALMISAPEYNASMPGSLKNTIDWMSRTRPQPFNGKQCFLLSASPSMVGGNRGLWALRVPLEHLGSRVYPDMFSLAQAHEAFAPDGRLANDLLQKRYLQRNRYIIAGEQSVFCVSLGCGFSAWVLMLGTEYNRSEHTWHSVALAQGPGARMEGVATSKRLSAISNCALTY